MVWETSVQSQVESYQRSKKWYLMPPCLTLSNISYVSRVKWSNPEKRVAPFPTPWCSSYRKGSLRVTLDYGRQLYFITQYNICPLGWGYEIYRLHHWGGTRPLTAMSFLDMTLNHLIERLWLWNFEECGVSIYNHYIHVHSYPKCYYLLESHL